MSSPASERTEIERTMLERSPASLLRAGAPLPPHEREEDGDVFRELRGGGVEELRARGAGHERILIAAAAARAPWKSVVLVHHGRYMEQFFELIYICNQIYMCIVLSNLQW